MWILRWFSCRFAPKHWNISSLITCQIYEIWILLNFYFDKTHISAYSSNTDLNSHWISFIVFVLSEEKKEISKHSPLKNLIFSWHFQNSIFIQSSYFNWSLKWYLTQIDQILFRFIVSFWSVKSTFRDISSDLFFFFFPHFAIYFRLIDMKFSHMTV